MLIRNDFKTSFAKCVCKIRVCSIEFFICSVYPAMQRRLISPASKRVRDFFSGHNDVERSNRVQDLNRGPCAGFFRD
jgi:hypothetical protein